VTRGDVVRILVDLGAPDPDVVDWVTRASKVDHAPEIVGFFSHVREDVARRARDAGFDRVLAKSRFVADLGKWLDPGGA